MALAIYDALAVHHPEVDLEWLVCSDCDRLREELTTRKAAYCYMSNSSFLSLWRNPAFTAKTLQANSRILRERKADAVVAIQGGILLSIGGVLSARLAGIPVCSYIPMAIKVSESKALRFPALMDFTAYQLFRLVPNFITIDAYQAEKIQGKNRRAKVRVVENFIPRPETVTDAARRREFKEKLGVPANAQLIVCAGRIEFAHKQQDWLLESLQDEVFMNGRYLLFVGSGTDFDALRRMIDGARGPFALLGWQNNMEEIYGAADVVVIPSRFEGVPLVMLEALGRGVPVVGSDLDGMKSWLPVEWRFPYHDKNAMKRAIDRTIGRSQCHELEWTQIESRLAAIHDQKRLADEFLRAVEELQR